MPNRLHPGSRGQAVARARARSVGSLAAIAAPTTLDPRGSGAQRAADLWWVMVGLGGAAFAVVFVGLLVGLRRNRTPDVDDDARRSAPDLRRATDTGAGRRWLLTGGVALPVVLVSVVLVVTVTTLRASADRSEDAALTVDVIGHRWWWEVRYPDHDIVTANEVHVPAGRTVELRLRSADVIHSFWVPALAGKLDLLPERTNTLWLDATEPGRYQGHCAEFCGVQHANMGLVVVAHDASGFDAWVLGQRAPSSDPLTDGARRGAELFVTEGCARCHAVRGTPAVGDLGPDLTHLGSRDSIGAGVLDNTLPDLRAWITDPHSVKDGVLMPDLQIDGDDVDALLEYLEGLR